MKEVATKKILAMLRIALGFIFLWVFMDKTWGLGFGTSPATSWVAGVSPTEGFLAQGTRGPVEEVFQAMAGNAVVDGLFMLGMLGVGIALITGMGMVIASVSGSLLMLLIYSAAFPPKTNPFMDQHLVYVLVLQLLRVSKSGDSWGLGRWWKTTGLVKRWPVLA